MRNKKKNLKRSLDHVVGWFHTVIATNLLALPEFRLKAKSHMGHQLKFEGFNS